MRDCRAKICIITLLKMIKQIIKQKKKNRIDVCYNKINGFRLGTVKK